MAKKITNRAALAAGAAPPGLLWQEEVKPPIGSVVALSIRKDATSDEVHATLRQALEMHKGIDNVREQLELIIGRTLLEVRERKLFGKHPNFEAFLRAEVIGRDYGVSRPTAYNYMRVAKAFPEVNSEQYREFGAMPLLEAAKVLPKVDAARRPEVMELLKKRLPLEGLKSALADIQGGIAAKQPIAALMFRVNPTLAQEYRTWADLADVKESASQQDGASDPPTMEDMFRLLFTLAQSAFKPRRKKTVPIVQPQQARQGVA